MRAFTLAVMFVPCGIATRAATAPAIGQYAASMVPRAIAPQRSHWRCTTARDWTTGEYTSIKNLSKLKKHGYPLESIIVVDDTPSKYVRSYGNLITVREFVGDRADAELPLLERYLQTLLPTENVRSIEKRRWREQVSLSEADPV